MQCINGNNKNTVEIEKVLGILNGCQSFTKYFGNRVASRVIFKAGYMVTVLAAKEKVSKTRHLESANRFVAILHDIIIILLYVL